LNAHSGYGDKVGAPEAIEIDVFDILVEQRHLMMVRDKRGEQA
jgi:hypothetical protein